MPLAALLTVLAVLAAGQSAGSLVVIVRVDGKPAPNIDVRAGERRVRTAEAGEATFELPAGTYRVLVDSPAHVPVSTTATVAEGSPTRLTIDLDALPEIAEEVFVTATRSGTRLRDQALRVEVIPMRPLAARYRCRRVTPSR